MKIGGVPAQIVDGRVVLGAQVDGEESSVTVEIEPDDAPDGKAEPDKTDDGDKAFTAKWLPDVQHDD